MHAQHGRVELRRVTSPFATMPEDGEARDVGGNPLRHVEIYVAEEDHDEDRRATARDLRVAEVEVDVGETREDELAARQPEAAAPDDVREERSGDSGGPAAAARRAHSRQRLGRRGELVGGARPECGPDALR